MEYDEGYQNEQAHSEAFKRHLEAVSGIVGRCLGRQGIVEIGCGKGYFLELLSANGFDIRGFDPAYEGSNPLIQKSTFQPTRALAAEGLVLRHVLEHVRNPYEFLDMIRAANDGRGRIYIEVPCFDWILEHHAWFDIFYEHVNYFRLSDFFRLFGRVDASGHLFGGQYLYVVAELSSLRSPRIEPASPVELPRGFLSSLGSMRSSGAVEKRPVCVWGGASKGVIFSLLRERMGNPVDMVVDVNPMKQGRYLAGTGLKVFSPKEALSLLPDEAAIYIMNSNYTAEIREMSGNRYHYIEIDHAEL
ncbi:MAG TPA: class I SAM-dependent methyltransferase [Azoarcus taiwanensis]|nr:class I SAM-dependent methyltransferase [Azoarcus taiwanensis]